MGIARKKMDFGEILSKAWKIIWKYKVLWIFGILASFGRGSGGGGGNGGGSNYRTSGNFNFDTNGLQNVPPEFRQMLETIASFMHSVQWWWVALIVLGLLVIALIFWVISIIGKTGLIVGTKQADEGVEKLRFGTLLSDSMKYFWRVLGFTFLSGLALFIIMMIIIVPLVLFGVVTAGIGMLCILPLFCVLIPVLMLVGVVLEQGIIAIVVEDIGMFAGLKRGWLAFKNNFWNMVVMALILGIGAGIIGFIISLPLLVAFLPLLAPIITSISSSSFDFQTLKGALVVSLGLCCLIYPFILFFNGILTGYVQSAWTLTYLRVTKKEQPVTPVETKAEVLPPLPDPS
jgi:hypothetical protein